MMLPQLLTRLLGLQTHLLLPIFQGNEILVLVLRRARLVVLAILL